MIMNQDPFAPPNRERAFHPGRTRRLPVGYCCLAQCVADRWAATPSPRSLGLAHLSGPVGWSPAGAGPPPRIYRWEKTTAVAVKIKLKRLGKIREPYYRIVVADSRTKRDGRAIEEIGKYHPKADPSLIEVNSERVQHWLSVGAQPTDPVRALLKVTGDWQKFTGEPGAEGTLRTAAPREDRKEVFAVAARQSQASKEAAEKASASARTGSRTSRPARTRATPAEEAPAETAAAAPAPAEVTPAEPAPAEPAPAEPAPAEPTPAEATAAEPASTEASADVASAEAASAEAASAEAAPAEAVSAEAGTGAPAEESGSA
jgi:small subunit ribosomal protein S16